MRRCRVCEGSGLERGNGVDDPPTCAFCGGSGVHLRVIHRDPPLPRYLLNAHPDLLSAVLEEHAELVDDGKSLGASGAYSLLKLLESEGADRSEFWAGVSRMARRIHAYHFTVDRQRAAEKVS